MKGNGKKQIRKYIFQCIISFNDFISETGIDTIYNGREIDCDDISYQLKQTLSNLRTARSVASNKNVLHPTNLHDSERGNLIVSVWSQDPALYDQYFIGCPEFDQTKFP